MTKTLFAIGFLIVFGAATSFLATIALNIAGLPGAMLAGTPGQRTKQRFQFGAVIATLGQSYIYLAYTAFIVNWTAHASRRDDLVLGFLLWPVALLAVFIPIWRNLIRGRVEAREYEFANPQVEALHHTLIIALLGFFVFAFFPNTICTAWGWVPYVRCGGI